MIPNFLVRVLLVCMTLLPLASPGQVQALPSPNAIAPSLNRVITEYHVWIFKDRAWRRASIHRLYSDAVRKANYYRSQGYATQILTVQR